MDARATDQTASLRLGAVGLALAAGMSSWLEYGLLRRHLARRRRLATRVGGGALTRTTLAGLVAGAAGIVVRLLVSGEPLLLQLLGIGAAIVVVYLLCAHLLGLPAAAQ